MCSHGDTVPTPADVQARAEQLRDRAPEVIVRRGTAWSFVRTSVGLTARCCRSPASLTGGLRSDGNIIEDVWDEGSGRALESALEFATAPELRALQAKEVG